MKRLLYILLPLCLTFVSCSEDLGQLTNDDGDRIVLNIYNTSLTKAVDVKGEDYERTLNRLDCFFYRKGETDQPCIYYRKVENVNKVGRAEVPFYVDESLILSLFGGESTCEVFVIANLSSEIIGDRTFETGQEGTDVETLGQFMLERSNGNYDAEGMPFVMAGLAECIKGSDNNAQATIALVRAAAKVTFSVIIPQSITVTEKTLIEGEEYDRVEREMKPVITDESMTAAFHNGASIGCIYGTYAVAEADLYVTNKLKFVHDRTIPEVPVSDSNPVAIPARDVYVCEMPLYTYARSWDKGDPKAAYWTFEMQWGYDSTGDKRIDTYRPYYYQILVNGAYRSFEPNHWYDMTVNVGVLGSTIEALPKVLEELSYYVFNWTTETSNGGSGDRLEDVELDKYNYLEVPQTYIEMDNVSKVGIRYNASHRIGVKWDTKGNKGVYGLDSKVNMSALFINNGSGKPEAVDMTGRITLKDPGKPDANETSVVSQFKDNNNGLLTFEYTLADDVYSPAYIFITIWLDVDGDGVHDSDEVMTQDVTIVMYPAIYIIGDNSSKYSVFINGNYNSNCSGGGGLSYLKIAGQQVGKAAGDDNNTYMHVITISAFNENNYKFAYNNNKNKDKEYIIGDPRVRSSNKLGVPDDNTTVKENADGWIKATDVTGTVRNLQYYYPTDTEANSYQVIAPKFRISSKLGGYSHSNPKGAAYRCASYQEHGFPAGRWRLPTTAEVLYIIELQRLDKIQQLFYGGTTYLSATDRVATDNNNNYTLTTGYPNDNSTPSVRCVYDEWFWGSEREAIANSSLNQNGGYQFTWGDRFIY